MSLVDWLADGDLRSDGFADEAAEFILQNPELIDELLSALDHRDPVVRGHAADALEKVGRTRPDLIKPVCDSLIARTEQPEPAAVRMHLSMIFGHLAVYPELHQKLLDVLLELLEGPGVFSRSWAISSLCIIGRLEPDARGLILDRLSRTANDSSIAIRTRTRKAIALLTDDSRDFPPGWVKSEQLSWLETGGADAGA
jgi:HEAT repeat protein